tara:strand:+ start:1735 stop:2178 length:444 start_codon:yes stop_codon:yes gene_type:complete
MTRVEFFIWPLCKKRYHDLAICNLISSIYRSEGSLTVLIEDTKERERFDHLLWTFEQTSFIPHGVDNTYPVELTSDAFKAKKNILMNLGPSCPMEPEKFEIIVETAGHDESTRSEARLKFKKYKGHGIEISSHKIEDITETKNISLR